VQHTVPHDNRAVQNQCGIDGVDLACNKKTERDEVGCSVHSVQSESMMNPSDKYTHAHGVATCYAKGRSLCMPAGSRFDSWIREFVTAIREMSKLMMQMSDRYANLHEGAVGTRIRGENLNTSGQVGAFGQMAERNCHKNHSKPFGSCESFCFKLSAVPKPLTELLDRRTHTHSEQHPNQCPKPSSRHFLSQLFIL